MEAQEEAADANTRAHAGTRERGERRDGRFLGSSFLPFPA